MVDVVRAAKSTATSVKLVAQKTAELPGLIEDGLRRRTPGDLSQQQLCRKLGPIGDILVMDPPKEIPDVQIWHAFTEGVLDNLKFLNKELLCVVSIGACAAATVIFSILEASGQIKVDASHFMALILWFLGSLLGAFLIKMAGLVLFDAHTWRLVAKMNEKIRIAHEKDPKDPGFFILYSVTGWITAERVLQLWGPKPKEPTLEAHFQRFGSAAVAYSLPIPKKGKFGLDALPPLRPNEVELVTNASDSYEVGEVVYSELLTVNGFSFRLAVYPQGFLPQFPCVAAFIEAEASKDDEWCYRAVKFQVTLINCIDYRRSISRIDEGDFHDVHVDRGWADLLPQELATVQRGWISSASGSMVFRAACSGSHPVPMLAPSKAPEAPTVYGKAADSNEAGSIESLVAEMKLHADDADLQRSSARALYDGCVGKDAAAVRCKQRAAEAGALEELAGAMRRHGADARLLSWAACPVASICSGDDDAASERKQRAIKAGTLEAMLAAVKTHRDEAKVHIWAACMVDRICQGTDVATLDRKQQAIEVGWLEALVAGMKAHGDDDDVQLYSAKALCNLCSGKPDSATLRFKLQAAQAGAIETLVTAMTAHREDVKVLGWCASALCSLTSSDDATVGVKLRHAAFKAGALEALTAALSCHEDLRLSSAAGCAGLQICGGSDDASDASAARKRKQKALEVGFSQLLPSLLVLQHLALALNTDDLEMRRRAAWALSEMLQFSDETLPQREVEAGVLEALSSAIASRDPELQRSSISVLYSICVGEDDAAVKRKQRAAQAGCLEALAEAMRHNKEAPQLQKDGACAMGNLCAGADGDAEMRKLRAGEAHGVQVLRNALVHCEGDEELLGALQELIRQLEAVLRKRQLEDDGASTVAWLEAPVPTERSHVQLEVDEEPPVPDEPSAAVPFVITTSLTLPALDTQPQYTPSVPSAQLRDVVSAGCCITGPVPVMTSNNCCEPRYVPMPAFAEDVSELPV